MKIHVFTSCSINYLPKARVLADSLRRYNPDAKLTLLLNDRFENLIDPKTEPFYEIITPHDLGYSDGWIFEHNVMELCTAVKGRMLHNLIKGGGSDIYIYLDPDCYVFNDISTVDAYLGNHSIGLVPHILTPETTDIGVQLTEVSVAEHGTYNLGHLFVRGDENGLAFAQWWMERLDRYCFDDKERGLFTDQRWIDMVPALFDGVKVLRVPNLDVASWNLAGRNIVQNVPGDETSFMVDGYPLLTYHFSGTGPTGTHFRVRNIFDSANPATAEIERIYEAAIQARGQSEFEHIEFAYGFFDDNSPIPAIARKIYRRHADLQAAFPNPFEISKSKLVFKDWLRNNRPGSVDGLNLSLEQVKQAFIDIFDSEYYLARYPEARRLVEGGVFNTAIEHYIGLGSKLFYDPNPYFKSSYYYNRARYFEGYVFGIEENDVSNTLLWHYLRYGVSSGVEPVPYFNSSYYLSTNPDVYIAYIKSEISLPLVHLWRWGDSEKRTPGPDFNPSRYLERNGDAEVLVGSRRVAGPLGAYLELNPYLEYDY